MEMYLKTLSEIESQFSTEEACREYLFELRWPDGFKCPQCDGREMWAMGNGKWLCRGCRRQVSVTAGTIFQGSRMPLIVWFRAMWHVKSQKNGASALGLQRVLGLGSYQTALVWLQKLRRAMIRPGRDRLSGEIEVDETYIGGERTGKRGRGAAGKTLVVIAAQRDELGIGRIRLVPVRNASGKSLMGAVQATVEPGSLVKTDGWDGYNGITAVGYRREIVHATAAAGENLLPNCHRVASLLKRWILGTHQGAVSHDHLAYYLDKFTFRFNRRTSASRGKLFYRLVQQAVQLTPRPYRDIIKPQPVGGG